MGGIAKGCRPCFGTDDRRRTTSLYVGGFSHRRSAAMQISACKSFLYFGSGSATHRTTICRAARRISCRRHDLPRGFVGVPT
jgi:hypothetical protein